MKLHFLGFGEAARAFRDSLAEAGHGISFAAWDRKLDDSAEAGEMRAAMESRGVAPIRPEGLSGADWIVSAVTADQSLIAAQSVADHLVQGQGYIDINSVSPGRKRETAVLVEGRGAAYLDMAVMAPVHPRGHATPVLIAGAPAADMVPALERLGFSLRRVGESPGQATAIKMCRSLFVKGLEAITVECLLTAEAAGCRDEIEASLAESYPGLGWPGFADYEFERTLRHGARRAAEMRECAATVDELGLTGALPDAIADVQDAMGACPATPEDGIAEILHRRREG